MLRVYVIVGLLGITLTSSALAVDCRKIQPNSESRSGSWRIKVSAPLKLGEVEAEMRTAANAPHARFTKAWNDFKSEVRPGDQLLLVEQIPLDPKLEHGISRYVIIRDGCIQDAFVVML